VSVDPFDLLGEPFRRRVLVELSRSEEPVDAGTLASAVANPEPSVASDVAISVDADEHDEVLVRLVHVTLPKLADAGWIEYDRESRTVQYRSSADEIRSALGAASAKLDWIRSSFERAPDEPQPR
jgi:DNA-binding transcriptional ArsR family regulator